MEGLVGGEVGIERLAYQDLQLDVDSLEIVESVAN